MRQGRSGSPRARARSCAGRAPTPEPRGPALRPRARPRLQRRHRRRRCCCGSPARRCSTTSGPTVQHNVNCRLARAVVVPDAIPPERLAPLRRARQAARVSRGSRRSTTSPTSSPTPPCSWSSRSIPGRPLVVVRTPPEVSLYHRFENDLFAACARAPARRPPPMGVQPVVLPRAAAQRAELRRRARLRRPRPRDRRPVADRLRRPRDLRRRHDEPRGRRARHARLHAPSRAGWERSTSG